MSWKPPVPGRQVTPSPNTNAAAGAVVEEPSALYSVWKSVTNSTSKGTRNIRNLNPFKRPSNAPPKWFNPEELTAQKREWSKQHGEQEDNKAVGWPSQVFESFIIVGLPPTTDVKSVVADAETLEHSKGEGLDMEVRRGAAKQRQHRGIKGHPLPPQILYSYPAGKTVTPDVASFCFPHGVQPVLLERTPSMSALNEVIYSQQYRSSDGQSFIFLMKVADNLPLYGVCCYMDEIIHRPPQLLRYLYPNCKKPLSRYLVSAPRCYCFLTHYPFFSLHLKVLHLVMGLERLERITAFIVEVDAKDANFGQEDPEVGGGTASRKLWEASPPGSSTPTVGDSSTTSQTMQRSASLLARASLRIKAAASFNADSPIDGFPATPKSPKPAFEGSSILRRASERMLRASATARARLMSGSGESSDSNSCGTPRIGPFQLECPRPQDDAKEGTPRSAISEITSRASQMSFGTRSVALSAAPLPTSPFASLASQEDNSTPVTEAEPAGQKTGQGQAEEAAELLEARARNPGEGDTVSQETPRSVQDEPEGGEGGDLPGVASSANPGGEPAARAAPLPGTWEASKPAVLMDPGEVPVEIAFGMAFAEPGGNMRDPGDSEDTDSMEGGASLSTAEYSDADPGDPEDYGLESPLTSPHHPPDAAPFVLDRDPGDVARSSEEESTPRARGVGNTTPLERGPSSMLALSTSCTSLDSASGLARPVMNGKALDNVRRWNLEDGSEGFATPEAALSEPSGKRDTPYGSEGPADLQSQLSEESASLRGALGEGLDKGRPTQRVGMVAWDGDSRDNDTRAVKSHKGQSALGRSKSTGILPRKLSGQFSGQFGGDAFSVQMEDRRSSHGMATPSTDEFQLERAETGPRSLRSHLSVRSSLGEDGERQAADAIEIVRAYYASPVPQPGEDFEFRPDPSLQPIHFLRPRASDQLPSQLLHRTAIAAAEAEAAEGLRAWTVATLCRSLSLDNIITLITAALLERQMVVFCPNIGVLSTVVLALVPLLRPYSWQSLLLPVLPTLEKMLDLLEAPVPFILGVQYKTPDVASRCSNLIRVNIYKDKIKNAGSLPSLPNATALTAALAPSYWTLNCVGRDKACGRPTYSITDQQQQAAEQFLQVMNTHLGNLCHDLQMHTITDVQTSERVSLLLKDSFVESFAPRDRTFIKQFVETQMFSVYSDSVIN